MGEKALGLHVRARSGPGVLHRLTGVIASHRGDITSVEIVERGEAESRVTFEVQLPGALAKTVTPRRTTGAGHIFNKNSLLSAGGRLTRQC